MKSQWAQSNTDLYKHKHNQSSNHNNDHDYSHKQDVILLLEFGGVLKEVRYTQIGDAILKSVLSAGKYVPEEDKANPAEVLVRKYEVKGAGDQSLCSHWARHIYRRLPRIRLPFQLSIFYIRNERYSHPQLKHWVVE